VINPPWTLFNSMSQLLPKLALLLANDESASLYYKCDVIKAE
jgi:23S rRNA A2030 N6-methylase RlmJ